MKNKVSRLFFFFFILFLCECTSQNNYIFTPVPDTTGDAVHHDSMSIENIIETKDGLGNVNIPQWLMIYFLYGTKEIEKTEYFINKYCFIGTVEGSNFHALNKWIENFSLTIDFPKLAADRIEKRLILSASLYPDDEYGSFYELLVKKAFDTEYPNAFLEDTFWVKKKPIDDLEEIYQFFVLVSIEKKIVQNIITDMMNEVFAVVFPTRYQNNAIKRLQYNFFEGF